LIFRIDFDFHFKKLIFMRNTDEMLIF